jgi:hypothetical protein
MLLDNCKLELESSAPCTQTFLDNMQQSMQTVLVLYKKQELLFHYG